MKKIIFLFFSVTTLFTGCRNSNVVQVDNESSSNAELSFALRPEIMDVIRDFRAYEGEDRVYAVYFLDKNDGGTMLKQDSIIYVSFLQEVPFVKDVNYRGILSIDSLAVAIFDRNDCGANFYDSTKLIYISLDHLKKLSKNTPTYAADFGVEGDSLIRWIGP